MKKQIVIVLFATLLSGCAQGLIDDQNDPIIDSRKEISFICEEYRVVLRDVRGLFSQGAISQPTMHKANDVRKRISPWCNGTKKILDYKVTYALVAEGLRELALLRIKIGGAHGN